LASSGPDRVCIYFDNQLIAHYPWRYGHHEDIEDPDHAKALIAERSRAREQRLMLRFLALSPDAQAYCDSLEQRRLPKQAHTAYLSGTSAPDRGPASVERTPEFRAFFPGLPGYAPSRVAAIER
jgi:hypothetical protein